MGKEKLVLVDGHSILNRAFYGMPDLTNAAGVHTGAVFGFLNILFKILDEEKADYLTVAFDVHAPGFNVFWGIDSYSFRVTPQLIPVDKSNIGMTFGVSFPI